MLILFNKPFNVLCQFTDPQGRPNLSDYIDVPDVYAAGRLDRDSEGLLLLTDDGKLQQRISDPKFRSWKTYWVQVEGEITPQAVRQLAAGVELKDGQTKPARAEIMHAPDHLWPRDPPVRYRASIPTSWLTLSLREGRNRQVRRMTAAVGFPTLRLIRYAIGHATIEGLAPGEWREAETGLLD